jgi:FkbM family methyltransferase
VGGGVIEIQGRWWPDDVIDRWEHALAHVASLEIGLAQCRLKRTAVQAGGNVGLWPARLAEEFAHVFTFEPDAATRACLERNVPMNVTVSGEALGRAPGRCGWRHKDLGSHRVVEEGETIRVTTVDALDLTDLDFLQLDVEGYEAHALEGARETIERCHPVIQVELRNLTERYGSSDAAVRSVLSTWGYRQVATAPGSDFIFRWGAA